MLIKAQRGSYTVNLDRIEAITTKREEGGEVAIYARTPDNNCYVLGRVDTETQAQAIIYDIAWALKQGAPLYTVPKQGGKRRKGGGLDWDGPPEAHTYHLKEQAERQTAAINFHPDSPTPTLTPAEQRARAEAAACRTAYRKAWEKKKRKEEAAEPEESGKGGFLTWEELSDWPASEFKKEIADDADDMETRAAEVKRQLEEAEAERKEQEYIDNQRAEEAAENLDIICCSYPEDARGAIITQTGEIIVEPADWQTVSAVPTPDGNLAITLEERGLDALGDPKCEIIGVYSEERALRVYRDLRAQIEDADTPVKITMPD